jgi:hypothetical protein
MNGAVGSCRDELLGKSVKLGGFFGAGDVLGRLPDLLDPGE